MVCLFFVVVRIQRGDGGVQEYLLHCVGCGRAGQDQVKKIRNFHTEAEVLKTEINPEYQFITWHPLKVCVTYFF